MRKLLSGEDRSANRGVCVVDCDDEHGRCLCPCCPQQVQARGVAVIDLVAEAPDEIDVCLVGIERCEGDSTCGQNTSDDLSEPTEPGDENLDLFCLDLVVGTPLCLEPLADHGGMQNHQQRTEHHRQRHG